MSRSQRDTHYKVPTDSGFARHLFDAIAANYDTWAQALSYGQYRRWHRALISVLPLTSDSLVLDLATGTGSVGRALRQHSHCTVVGLDLSPGMLAAAQRRNQATVPEEQLDLLLGTADCLPFADGRFNAVVFTFLLRYVPDPLATLRELARVTKPGGLVASLEFFIPPQRLWRWLWHFHTGVVLPLAGVPLGRGWGLAGRFLGGSIRDFYRRYSLEDVKRIWQDAGFTGVAHRMHSLGGAVVIWGYRL